MCGVPRTNSCYDSWCRQGSSMWHGPYYALSHKMISQSGINGAQRKCLPSSDLMPGSCLTTPIPLSQRKEGKRHGIGSHACFQQLPLSQDGPPTAAVPACTVVYRERTEKHIEVVTKTAQQTQAVKILEGASSDNTREIQLYCLCHIHLIMCHVSNQIVCCGFQQRI